MNTEDEEICNCVNFDRCGYSVTYKGRGRKPKRCKSCQLDYSKKLRRDAYRKKVKDKVKTAECDYKLSDGKICGMAIPYITKKPRHCPKHARQVRLDWMRKYYTGEKVVQCERCRRPIKYETKKPELCTMCRARERIQSKRVALQNRMTNVQSKDSKENREKANEER